MTVTERIAHFNSRIQEETAKMNKTECLADWNNSLKVIKSCNNYKKDLRLRSQF